MSESPVSPQIERATVPGSPGIQGGVESSSVPTASRGEHQQQQRDPPSEGNHQGGRHDQQPPKQQQQQHQYELPQQQQYELPQQQQYELPQQHHGAFMSTGNTSQTPMFPPPPPGHPSHSHESTVHLGPQVAQGGDTITSEDEITKLRISCKKILICEGLLSIGLFFVFWSCFVVPFIVGILGLVTSLIGVTHYCSQRDLHHNNCCCKPLDTRHHLVRLQLALVIADSFGISACFAGIANITKYHQGERYFSFALGGAVMCLILSVLLLVAAIRGYRQCKLLRRRAPPPHLAAFPPNIVLPHQTYMYVHSPSGPQYYAQSPLQQQPVVVGTIVG